MSTIAYESYHSSPMPAHHPWVSFNYLGQQLNLLYQVIRKSIGVAVYTLPDSQTFCKKIAPELAGEELLNTLREVESVLEEVFSRTDILYIKHELDNIP